MSFKQYDVDGYDTPLRLSDEHAEAIGAVVHVPAVAEAAEDEAEAPKPVTRARKPKE